MADPRSAQDYTPAMVNVVRSTCLYLAVKLADLLKDLVVVGGMAPQLLVDPRSLPPETRAHVGTQDLDLGLSIALLNKDLYEAVRARLLDAGFVPDHNHAGNLTRQRWVLEESGCPRVTIDFLVPRISTMSEEDLQSFDVDFAAIRTEGLELAFEDRCWIDLSGLAIDGARIDRPVTIPVCGPASFLVLKAFALKGRSKGKDAYDLIWLLQNYPGSTRAYAEVVRPYLARAEVGKAIGILREAFLRDDSVGPVRVARFIHKRLDPEEQAAAVATVAALLATLKVSS